MSVKSKATPISPNERRGPPSTPERSVRKRIIRRKYHEAKKEMDKGNYKGRALKDLFHYLKPGVYKSAVAALMSSDDESEDDLEHLDDSESDDDDDDDDDEKNPPRSDLATSTLLGVRIEFMTRGTPHCHFLIRGISTKDPPNLSAESHSATPHPKL